MVLGSSYNTGALASSFINWRMSLRNWRLLLSPETPRSHRLILGLLATMQWDSSWRCLKIGIATEPIRLHASQSPCLGSGHYASLRFKRSVLWPFSPDPETVNCPSTGFGPDPSLLLSFTPAPRTVIPHSYFTNTWVKKKKNMKLHLSLVLLEFTKINRESSPQALHMKISVQENP